MEPETADDGTRVSQEHPDWFLSRDGERLKNVRSRPRMGAEHTPLLDLSQAEVAKWVENEVSRVIDELGVDQIFWDYNQRPGCGGQRLMNGYIENTTWRYYENLYRMLETLAEKYPDVTWVNCASGGARNDLGILQRAAHAAFLTDYTVMPRHIKTINGMSMALPPEAMEILTDLLEASTQWGDFRTQMRLALFCGNWMITRYPVREFGNRATWDIVAHYVRLSKGFIRDTMKNCSVYHHTPELPVDKPGEWCVLEYVAENANTAYAGIFRLEQANSDEYLFRSRGLDPATRYEVTLENSQATITKLGQEIRENGIRVRLPVPLTSELLLFSKADMG